MVRHYEVAALAVSRACRPISMANRVGPPTQSLNELIDSRRDHQLAPPDAADVYSLERRGRITTTVGHFSSFPYCHKTDEEKDLD